MAQSAPLLFNEWQNFYVVVGSAAGALTGLQFVVIALVAQTRAAGSIRDIRAFGTPTVVHFCSALMISALMVMPWRILTPFGVCLGGCGVFGLVNSSIALWHARKAAYRPDLEDWIWYSILPFVAHIALLTAAGLLFRNATWSLFTIAADSLFFLILGIHNAWDTVTYIAVKHARRSRERQSDDVSDSGSTAA